MKFVIKISDQIVSGPYCISWFLTIFLSKKLIYFTGSNNTFFSETLF